MAPPFHPAGREAVRGRSASTSRARTPGDSLFFASNTLQVAVNRDTKPAVFIGCCDWKRAIVGGRGRLGRAGNLVVLFTNFGLHGPYTGQMKAVLHQMVPGIPVIYFSAYRECGAYVSLEDSK